MHLVIENMRVQYDVRGEGDPVLLLHGWGANIETMRAIADLVVSMNMRAVSLDFPGFGGSDEPPEAWGVPEYAALTRKFIDEMNLKGCDVVAHSFGGRVSILLASEEPDLFNRLVLVDAAGVRPKRGLRYYLRIYTYKLGRQLARFDWADAIFHLREKQKNAGSEDYRALKSDLMRRTFVKVVNLDLTDRLQRIQNATLLIWGSEDTSTPLYMGKIMEKKIPDAGLVVFEGAGHYSYVDQYPRFCAVLRAFLVK